MGVSNKTLIIIFVAIILIIALILGGKIGYDYYMDSCEVENEVILNFIEDMVKGHKSYSDIDSLEASEDVKENLREFYSGFFFEDDYKLKIYNNVSLYNSVKDDVKKFYDENFNGNKDDYEFAVYDLFPDCLEYLLGQEEYNLTQEQQDRYTTMLYYLNYSGKDSNYEYEIIDGDLYVNINDLVFGADTTCKCYYDGLEVVLYRDALEKHVRTNIMSDTVLQISSLVLNSENDNLSFYKIGTYCSFTVKYSMGKIVSIEF